MPFIVKCSNCGHLFYYSSNVAPIIEILESLQTSCPRCGKRLEKVVERIKIKISPTNVEAESRVKSEI